MAGATAVNNVLTRVFNGRSTSRACTTPSRVGHLALHGLPKRKCLSVDTRIDEGDETLVACCQFTGIDAAGPR
jgi:hypothetical protein